MNSSVKYELAISLKEKGFDEECKYYYDLKYKELSFHQGYVGDIYKNSEIENGYGKKHKFPMVSAPTTSETIMWLYEKHKIWVYVRNFETLNFCAYILKNGETEHSITNGFKTPTEAYEVAIEYCLTELI